MSLSDKIRGTGLKAQPRRTEPVWKGPEQDGVTYSMLCRFLCCRERFRLLVVEGLKPIEQFNHRIEYGQMWHVCEEAFAKGWKAGANLQILTEYCQDLCKKYPLQQEQIDHWYNVVKVQFPLYVEHWAKHPDVVARQPLLQEQVFDVPYKLPSGRTVRLRGKWDSVDLVGKGKDAAIWLQENKTKGDIREEQLQRQLTFDLQVMTYLVALQSHYDKMGWAARGPIAGVRYNVIRRPLSGGKGTIVRHKPSKSNPAGETKEHFYGRVRELIEAEPEYYFMRWNVEVTPTDVLRFRGMCLDPVLEQLCDWWNHVRAAGSQVFMMNYQPALHWRHPFGVYNVLDEGGSTDLDEYLISGSEAGLRRVDELFPELKEGG